MLSFAQVNLHKSAHATTVAGLGLAGKKLSIMMITEPYVRKNRLTGLPPDVSLIHDLSLIHI